MKNFKINKTLKEIGIQDNMHYPLCTNSNTYINYYICDDIKDYKKGLKKALKLYKKFNFDTLVFKIDFPYSEDLEFENISYANTVLNRFLNICKLKKPTSMKKVLYKDAQNLPMERIYFYWDLDLENIAIKELFKEIMFVNFDGFLELFSSVFFIDTKEHILFNFYDNSGIEILSNDTETLFKFYK